LRPENTLPGFELALDLGVSSIETDVHLTRDGVPVLFHDATVSGTLCSPPPSEPVLVSELTLGELRRFRVDRNPDPRRFPHQEPRAGPLSRAFADQHEIDALGIPTLAELFQFAAAYAGAPGREVGKTPVQQQRVGRVVFDLELKRVPFAPQSIGDEFDGTAAGLLERRVVKEVERAGMLKRIRIRSFDHRSVRVIRQLQELRTAVVVAHTRPVRAVDLLEAAAASVYCPDYRFVDAQLVQQIHDAGKSIVPWTVNQPHEWQRLLDWAVDGVATDFPDQLLAWLRQRGIEIGEPGA
jgi:glycerophosphoryl diester phosphodiesterase